MRRSDSGVCPRLRVVRCQDQPRRTDRALRTGRCRDPSGTQETLAASGQGTQTTTYSYDGLGRLSQTLLPTGVCRNYSYDADSNRSQIAESSTGCGGTFTTTATYAYTPATNPGVDQLTSVTTGSGTTNYAYTADGQVKSYGTSTLTWDGWQRVSGGTFGGTTVTYKYDPSGGLRTRTSSNGAYTRYLLGDLFETDATGHITTAYVDGPNGDLAQYNGPPAASSTITYLYYNAHGDLAAEANSSGTRTALHTYDPFGAPLDTAPLDTQPTDQTAHRYTGAWAKQYDTASDLILMGARPYDPSIGRFLAVDPVDGGSLNGYDYAAQDPVNNYDLSGEVLTDDGVDGGKPPAAVAAQLLVEVYECSCMTPGRDAPSLTGLGKKIVKGVESVAKTSDELLKKNFDACLQGAVVGALGGFGSAAAGCATQVIIDNLEHSTHKDLRLAGYTLDILSSYRDAEDVQGDYERLAAAFRKASHG